MISRKKFLVLATTGSIAAAFGQTPQPKKEKGDPLPYELVKEWIGKCHSDFGRVQELFKQDPRLLNASIDHGGGDFESGLEAAGHVGNHDIAMFLLAHGARMNIFCAAMLGQLDIVKSVLKAFPELKHSAGPHGLKLIHHAQKGGDGAKKVLKYLEKIGAA